MNVFLENLSQESRVIFLRRYWFCDTIAEIAERYGISESKVKMRLLRTRTQLADTIPLWKNQMVIALGLALAGQNFSTDSTLIDLSGCTVTVEEVEQMLPYFPRLEKLDMSFCGISDEEMEELNLRHPDVSIVWTLKIGEVRTRTDAVYFYPAESNYYPTNAEMTKLS